MKSSKKTLEFKFERTIPAPVGEVPAHDFVREVANCEQMSCLQAFDQRGKVWLLAVTQTITVPAVYNNVTDRFSLTVLFWRYSLKSYASL